MSATPSTSIAVAGSPIYQDLEQHEIRLLHLHPNNDFNAPIHVTLKTVDFSDEPVYRALSYVWGDPDVTSAILVNGTIFEATTNLVSALCHLRKYHGAEVLWVDAVCMNQKNVEERNHQVQIMAKIYRNAEEVIAWLGTSGDDSDEAMKFLRRWGSALSEKGVRNSVDIQHLVPEMQDPKKLESFLSNIENPFSHRAWLALGALFKRTYWRRLWIVQEFVLAKKATLMCGTSFADRSDLLTEHFFHTWNRHAPLTNLTGDSNHEIVSDVIQEEREHLDFVNELMKFDYRTKYGAYSDRGFFKMLFDLSFRTCTDPRDYLFAATGFCTLQSPQIEPDYILDLNSASMSFSRRCLAQNRFAILSSAGIGYKNEAFLHLHAPTWVSVWCPTTRSRAARPSYYPYDSFSAGGHYRKRADSNLEDKSNSDSLSVSGVILDTVDRLLEGFSDWEEPKDTRWRTVLPQTSKYDAYVNRISMLEAYFRTLFADHIGFAMQCQPIFKTPSEIAPPESMERHRMSGALLVIWMKNNFLTQLDSSKELQEFLTRSRAEKLLHPSGVGYFFSQADEPKADCWIAWELAAPRYLHVYRSSILSGSEGRSFFTTTNGYMGTGPPYAKLGDKVCIIQGANVPFILRPNPNKEKGGYLLVGEAFVLGLMYGEYKGSFEEIIIH